MHPALLILHADILVRTRHQRKATFPVAAGDNRRIDGGNPVALARGELHGTTLGGNSGKNCVVEDGVEAIVNDLEGRALGSVNVEICDGADPVCEVVPGISYAVVGERRAEVDGEGGGWAGGGVCLWREDRKHGSREERQD